jgi:hypothetical protein
MGAARAESRLGDAGACNCTVCCASQIDQEREISKEPHLRVRRPFLEMIHVRTLDY